MSRWVDAVVFDLGGVLMRNGSPDDFARRYPGVDPDVVMPLIMGPYGSDGDHPWHRLERGEITMAECRAANRAALAEAGITLPPAESPSFGWERNDAMFALVDELRAAGVKTAVLTNNVREFRDAWRALADYDALFDDVVDSHEVGIRKPNPAIYELALTRLNVMARRAVFLDDLLANVAAAGTLGMRALHVMNGGGDAIAVTRRLAGLASN